MPEVVSLMPPLVVTRPRLLCEIDADLREAAATKAGLVREIGELLADTAACDDVTDALLDLRAVVAGGMR